MGKKKIIGIEIGNNRMKIAQCDGEILEKYVSAEIPDNLVFEDEILSWEAMAEFLEETLKKNEIKGKNAAIVMPDKLTYSKRVVMPAMTVDQLKVNLPFEFHDYISEDKDKYFFDYALVNMEYDEEGKPESMELMAIAAPKELVDNYKTMLRRAGLRLTIAAPDFAAFRNIIKKYRKNSKITEGKDYAILDIGHRMLRLHFFSHGEYEITRNMDIGLDRLTRVIADKENVDYHVAQIKKEANQDQVLTSEESQGVYSEMAIEVMRVLNFYNFNHADNSIDTLYCCGGGMYIEPLLEEISRNIDISITPLTSMLEGEAAKYPEIIAGPQALGITWE